MRDRPGLGHGLCRDVGGERELHGRHPAGPRLCGKRTLTAVRRAEVEGVGRSNPHGKEELAVDELGADDRAVGGGQVLLEKQQLIGAEEIVFGSKKMLEVVEALDVADVGTASAHVRLENRREGEVSCPLEHRRAVVEDHGPGRLEPEPLDEELLGHLARLQPEGAGPVDDPCAGPLEGLEPPRSDGDRGPVASQVGARAHPVDDQRMVGRVFEPNRPVSEVDSLIKEAAPAQGLEELLHPLPVLVEDGDGGLLATPPPGSVEPRVRPGMFRVEDRIEAGGETRHGVGLSVCGMIVP